MTEIKAEGNMLNSKKYPDILDNTINFILPYHSEANKKELAKIKVVENRNAKSGVTVHMFDDNKRPTTNFFTPTFSDKQVVTDSDGIATLFSTQTTLYFGVFDNNRNVLGSTALTIRKGQTKEATILY